MIQDDASRLFFAMCLISIDPEDVTLKAIRQRFMNRDKSWSEAEAQAEYRHQHAVAILDKWKEATGRYHDATHR